MLGTSFSPLRRSLAVFPVLVAGAILAVGPLSADTQLDETLAQLGDRIEQYYQHAQRILSTETVLVQPLKSDFSPDGPARRLVNELRVEWTPSETPGEVPEANVVRHLISVNGRPVKPNDEPGCTDPKAVAPEPLMMLLPEH